MIFVEEPVPRFPVASPSVFQPRQPTLVPLHGPRRRLSLSDDAIVSLDQDANPPRRNQEPPSRDPVLPERAPGEDQRHADNQKPRSAQAPVGRGVCRLANASSGELGEVLRVGRVIGHEMIVEPRLAA